MSSIVFGSVESFIAKPEGILEIIDGKGVAQRVTSESPMVRIPSGSTIRVIEGCVDGCRILSGEVTTVLVSGQEVAYTAMAENRLVRIDSVKGRITLIAAGVTIQLAENGSLLVGVNAESMIVHCEVVQGTIEVRTLSGESQIVTQGHTLDIAGRIQGEIQSIVGKEKSEKKTEKRKKDWIIEDEPKEPEIPEASAYRP